MRVIKEEGEKKIKEADKKVALANEVLKNATKKVAETQANITYNSVAKKIEQDDELHAKNAKTLSYMNNAKKMSADLFNSTKTQSNTTVAPSGQNATDPKPPATHALIEAEKDIVIQDPHKKPAVVPQAMDVTMNHPSASLPVYTQKKWIPNKDEVDEENLKSKPTFAKIQAPKKGANFTVLPDLKTELMVQVDNELVTLQKSVKSTFAEKPKNEMEAVQLQMEQLDKIKIVADKLKNLRSKRDQEKKKFDQEVVALAEVRKEINEQK